MDMSKYRVTNSEGDLSKDGMPEMLLINHELMLQWYVRKDDEEEELFFSLTEIRQAMMDYAIIHKIKQEVVDNAWHAIVARLLANKEKDNND